MKNFIGICKFSYQGKSFQDAGVQKPPEVPNQRIGSNTLSLDRAAFLQDSILRRHYLSGSPDPDVCNVQDSLSLLLARRYLAQEKIEYVSPWKDEKTIIQDMQLGKTVIPQLYPGNSSAYHDPALLGGYNTLLNYRLNQGDLGQFVQRVSLVDLLTQKVPAEAIRGKIVLIGYVDFTDRNADYFQTPYGKVPGVIIHAQGASQLISAVLDQRPLIRWWPAEGELLWMLLWAMVGGGMTWWFVRPGPWLMTFTSSLVILVATSYGLLAYQGVWVPLVPATASYLLAGAGVMILNYRRRHPSVDMSKAGEA